MLTEIIVNWLKGFINNEYLLLFVLSTTPLFEMRGSVVLSGGMDVHQVLACLASLAGSSLVVLPLLWLFRPIMSWLRKTKLFSPLANLIEESVKVRAEQLERQNQKLGKRIYLALYIFVAIPLPLTGVWIGSLIAAFCNLKFWKSVLAIILGNVTAAIILNILIWAAGEYVDIVLIAFVAIAILSSILILSGKWQKKKKQKNEIIKIESSMPKEEPPVIGEFASGYEEDIIVVELVSKENDKIIIDK